MKDNMYNPMPGQPGCDCGQPPKPQCPPPCPPPEFPPFCPEDRPVMGKPCCPPPPMPPAPSVVSGMDLYEAMNHLSDRVNVCIHNYNQVMAENYKALHNMQRAAEENGAYYGPGEVWVEEGYYPDESATYHIVHKACVDRRGEPIRVQLHLAYGNTTNSEIEQGLFSASKVEYADKMFVAIPLAKNQVGYPVPQAVDADPAHGWYGKALWHGCPIPATRNDYLWTVGFTKAGVMRVYNNGASIDQMLRDTVEDAMGVSGVLVMDGKVTDDSYQKYIPYATEQKSRVCMGQNMATREVVFLTVGDENDVNRKGMTSKACAEILRQYGCDIAVELCEGVGSGAMDKGSLMYVPDDTNEPSAYAFWFISRKCFYKNDYERELAELVQNYGACIWGGFLNKKAIAQVKAELDEEVQRAKDAEEKLQENIDAEAKAREDADKVLQGNIDKEAKAREDADKALQANIDAEAQAREAGDDALQEGLDAEKLARQNADTALQQNINKEAQARQDADTALQGNIDKEAEARAAADRELSQKIQGLDTRLTAAEAEIVKLNQLMVVLQQQMASLDSTVTELAKTIADIETSLNNVKQSVITLVSRVDEISTTVNNIISGDQDLPYVKRAGDTMTGDLRFGSDTGITMSNATTFRDSLIRAQTGHLRLVASNNEVRIEPNAVTLYPASGTRGALRGIATPTADDYAAPKDYVDQRVLKTGDTMTGDLKMADDSGTVKGSLSDTADGVALSAEDGACLKVGAEAVTVCDNAGGNAQIKGVKDGEDDHDAVTCGQLSAVVAESIGSFVKKTGDRMTGDLSLYKSGGKQSSIAVTTFDDTFFGNFYTGNVGQKANGKPYFGFNASGSAPRTIILDDTDRRKPILSIYSVYQNESAPPILRGLRAPIQQDDAVNKGYVDGLVTAVAPELSDFTNLEMTLSITGSSAIDLTPSAPVSLDGKNMVALGFTGAGTAKGSGTISFEYDVDESGFGWMPVYCSLGQGSAWPGGAYIWHNAEIGRRSLSSVINVGIGANSAVPIVGTLFLKYLPLVTVEISPE